VRSLRALKREDSAGRFVFMTERKTPMTRRGFHNLVARVGTAAKFPLPVHPHMLRQATGYALANDGQDSRSLQDYCGHKNMSTRGATRSHPRSASGISGRIEEPSSTLRKRRGGHPGDLSDCAEPLVLDGAFRLVLGCLAKSFVAVVVLVISADPYQCEDRDHHISGVGEQKPAFEVDHGCHPW
jgi:hypothetical protein